MDKRQVTRSSENYSEHNAMRCLGVIKWRELHVGKSGCGPVVVKLKALIQVQGHVVSISDS